MPRICPMQLLNCLSVLLSPNGGIKSRDEVQRLASLMTKFSKKLVSKCIYIQILKCTETDLLGLFMGSGGWRLVHIWLTESVVVKNWPLVRELLELLLLCPVDIERLKTNNCPKLVKELSKDGNHYAIRALASKLVEQWLKTVKGEQVVPIQLSEISNIITDTQIEKECEAKDEIVTEKIDKSDNESLEDHAAKPEKVSSEQLPNKVEIQNNGKVKDDEKETETLPVLKISLKNGKQILSQVDDNDSRTSDEVFEKEKTKDRHKNKSREKHKDGGSNSSRSTSSKHSSKGSSSNEKHKNSHNSSSSKHSNKDRTKNKEKHSTRSSKSKHDTSSSSSSKRSSSSGSKSKEDKSKHGSEKERSKDKDEKGKESPKPSTDKSEEKLTTPSIQKLGKIPKLSDVKREKPSISIEIRKPDEPKPKTVKTFNSKFRKHGLEEEVKPPPSRAALLNKKPPPVLPPTIPIPKRPSPVHNETPPEKKLKTTDIIEKPGSIKLIPPKPKRNEGPQWPLVSSRNNIYLGCYCKSAMMLLESDMFMDALNASATNKKEPKKRKRRTSGSRDGNAPNEASPPHTPTSITSPNSESKSVPPRFYQDTLETDDKQTLPEKITENEEPENDKEAERETPEKMEISEPHTLTINGLKGVLCYHKRKGPKKTIKWKPDSELEEIQYFELDETERVNVTKTFTDMKYLERINEREAFEKARNLSTDDVMEERTSWKPLILIDLDGQIQVEYGKNSKEKDIQAIRQKGTLQPLYFHKSMIPDSPIEPEPETHTYSEPTIIPLDDVTGNQDNISDFRNMPWPEPRGNAPPSSNTNMNVPSIFPPNMAQFPTNFPGTQFPGVPPGFQGSPVVPTDWQNGIPPHIMPNGIPGPMPTTGLPPGPMPPGNMPPGMMIPPDNMMMGPDMFGAPNPMFSVPPEGFNMQQNMFPMDFNMPGPQGPPAPDSFSGPGSFRGAMRGRGAGGHWRGKGGGNWEGPPRGRGGHARGSRKVVCIYFQRKGSCRQGENCSFLHPGVNCPY